MICNCCTSTNIKSLLSDTNSTYTYCSDCNNNYDIAHKNMAIDAILKRDYLLIQGYTVWIAVAFVIINLMTDLVYRYIDPRIKLGKEED